MRAFRVVQSIQTFPTDNGRKFGPAYPCIEGKGRGGGLRNGSVRLPIEREQRRDKDGKEGGRVNTVASQPGSNNARKPYGEEDPVRSITDVGNQSLKYGWMDGVLFVLCVCLY